MKWTVEWAWVPKEPHLQKDFHTTEVEEETPVKAAEQAFRRTLGRELQKGCRVYDTVQHDEVQEWTLNVSYPDKGIYAFAIRKLKPKRTYEQLLQNIYDLFYLDSDAKGEFYNPDKEVNGADFVEAVGEILEEFKPVPLEINRG